MKEKAKELVQSFIMFTWLGVQVGSNYEAKQCALICINEKEKTIKDLLKYDILSIAEALALIEELEEFKQEIKQL